MGSGNYHQDIVTARLDIGSTRESNRAFDYSRRASRGEASGVHPDLNVFGKVRECRDSKEHPKTTPIVVAMDVTSSRGSDAKVIYGQVPSLLGSLKVTGLVPDPEIMWCAIGDANSDRAPIQASQFESDRRMDEQLRKIWMEEGGGGTGEESYELLAWYLAHKTEIDATRRGKKGFVFFTGDEAPYPALSRSFVESYIGDKLRADVATEKVFEALQKKYHAFLIFPRSSMEERRTAIDTEIKRRLEAAGGRFREVDIRASLIWNDRNDLDLHCLTPGGFHIYYGAKRAHCGGELDVDQNVCGENPKPVENIRWAKGDARRGKYKFWVELYRYHEHSEKDVPFKVELDIGGRIQTFEGCIPRGRIGSCGAQTVFEFNYSQKAELSPEKDDHAPYRDDVILDKWGRYISKERILRVQDPASTVETVLGAIALQQGVTLDEFAGGMRERRVAKERREDVCSALSSFANQGVYAEVPAEAFD